MSPLLLGGVGPVDVRGPYHSFPTLLFNRNPEWNAPLVVDAASCSQPTLCDPVDDGAGGDAETSRDFTGGHLALLEHRRRRDVVVSAQGRDRIVVEWPASSGDKASRVELVRDVVVGEMGEAASQVDRRTLGPPVLGDRLTASDYELVGCTGVPADADACLGEVGFSQQGDVSNQGAQQTLAIPRRGARRVPQRGDV